MSLRFYIIEDDVAVQSILSNLIVSNNLGDVIDVSSDGKTAVEEVLHLKPDIVLVDLLLPRNDGISIVSEIKSEMNEIHFVMISEVTSRDLISKAYQVGIELFIKKPINIIEFTSVIGKLSEKLRMAKVISSFENAINSMDLYKVKEPELDKKLILKRSVKELLIQLGIYGDKGSADIIEIILYLDRMPQEGEMTYSNYKMADLYNFVVKENNRIYGRIIRVKAVEQRVRRSVFRALENIANMGVEDYANEVFVKYSSVLFEYREVRTQMDYIRGKTYVKGTVNVRKFIEGVIMLCMQ